MIVDERMVTFIDSLDKGNTPFLDEIEKKALQDMVPIVRKSTQNLLKFLLALQKPKKILEVGTAIGFSALLMSEYAPRNCRVTTIENYEKRIPIARANFEKAGKKDEIILTEIQEKKMKWIFSEITQNSFHWQHMQIEDGQNWYVFSELFATRRV